MERGSAYSGLSSVARVSNYFKSQGVGWRKQLLPPDPFLDHPDVENLKSVGSSPDQAIADHEQFEAIEAKLTEIPPRWAEAIRSKYELPSALDWAELVANSGTSRQNMEKLVKKGLEELKLRLTNTTND